MSDKDTAAKTSENFQGVSPEYATYTNEVDKPYPAEKVDPEANVPEYLREKDEAKKDEAKKNTVAKSASQPRHATKS